MLVTGANALVKVCRCYFYYVFFSVISSVKYIGGLAIEAQRCVPPLFLRPVGTECFWWLHEAQNVSDSNTVKLF